MEYDFREVLDIGLEIEFSNIKRETPSFIGNLHKELANFKHVHDASTETPELTLGNIPVQFDIDGKTNKILSIMRARNFEIFGGELNSPVLSSNDFRTHIYKLIDFLIDMGESFSTTEQDNRGSIHVHVNVSKDIKHKHLIRLLELGLATEAIFFRLGGMGRVNRGVNNSFIYQRPITMPPCVNYNGRVFPIFDYKDLLVTKNKTDFYSKYGDTVSQIAHGNHYVTQRYVGLNFYSIPYRGSLEFRYANKVLIPEWIIAWIILCQSFCNYALTISKDESFENTYRKLEDNRDIPESELLEILGKIGVPADSQITLLDIWRNSSVPEFNGKHILTHLPNPTFFNRDNYLPNPVESAERIIVEDVRTVNQIKNVKLQTSQTDYPEVDYIVDSSGVKSKLRNIEISPNIRLENNEDVLRNWMMSGLNLRRPYTQEDVISFIFGRLARGKIVPLECLTVNNHYEVNTPYDDFHIVICTKDDRNKVEFFFYKEEDGKESRVITGDTMYSDAFGCKAFNFSEYINDYHYNPENYFDEEDDDLFEIEDIPDENNQLENNQPNNNQNAAQELINRLNEQRMNNIRIQAEGGQ